MLLSFGLEMEEDVLQKSLTLTSSTAVLEKSQQYTKSPLSLQNNRSYAEHLSHGTNDNSNVVI